MPRLIQYCVAIFMATSTATEPESEKYTRVRSPGSKLRKTPCQHKCLLVNEATKHDVRHRRELRFHGLSDVRVIVAVAGRPPAGDAVDQFAPVGQSDARALGAHNR